MKKYIIILILFFGFIDVFSQSVSEDSEKKRYGVSYDYFFLNNSNYNTKNIDFNYLNDYRVRSNLNIALQFLDLKKKCTILYGLSYQNFYAITGIRYDTTIGNNKIIPFEVIKYRNMHLVGVSYGLEKEFNKFSINISTQLGWYFYKLINDFTPENYFVGYDDRVLSQFFYVGISGGVKYRLFKTEKFETRIRFSANERFLEIGPNFTIGLGLELNFLK